MLPRSIHYGTDSFQFRRQALLKSRQPLDFSYETSVTGLQISGTEPEGCNRRVIFEVDGKLYRFGNGGLDIYDDRAELEDILLEGNTVGELLALDEDALSVFVGKKVFPWFALDAPADSPVMPRIKISATVNSYNDVYTRYYYSPIYELKHTGDAARISDIISEISTNGNGIATLQCRICSPVTGWGDWIFPIETRYKDATHIQFRVNCILSTLDGSDSVSIGQVITFFSNDRDVLSSDSTEIFSGDIDYYADLDTCYALVKHDALKDCDLKAYVKFSQPVTRRENIPLGVADGTQQTFYLMSGGVVDKNVAQDTIHISVDGKTLSGCYFDTASSTVTFTATTGAEIVASYDCGLNDELWREMELDFSRDVDGVQQSRFVFRLADTANQQVSAVRFTFNRQSSRAENQLLGVGTGKLQTFHLEHAAKTETIICSGSWKYDEQAQILSVIAPIGADIICSYDWLGKFPRVYEILSGWTADT